MYIVGSFVSILVSNKNVIEWRVYAVKQYTDCFFCGLSKTADHDATSKEVDTRERKASSKVVGLLVQCMEGRDEKIQKQELLIDSLVGEIERLQLIEERDSALQGQILKEAHLNPLALRQEGDLVRSDGRNKNAELVSAQTSPQVPWAGEIYADYYEQIFNPFSPKRATFGLSESCSLAMANRAVQDGGICSLRALGGRADTCRGRCVLTAWLRALVMQVYFLTKSSWRAGRHLCTYCLLRDHGKQVLYGGDGRSTQRDEFQSQAPHL